MRSKEKDRREEGETKKEPRRTLSFVSSNPSKSVLAILVGDVHLSKTPPRIRRNEPDWFKAMRRPLEQIRCLKEERCCPVIYSGDLFHSWNSPAELINFAIKHLPRGYAICGKHDLPNHNLNEIKKSAFYTLVEANVLTLLEPNKPVSVPGKVPLILRGFPCGYPVRSNKNPHDLGIEVAVVHAYIWSRLPNTGYVGAPKDTVLSSYEKRLKGYDVAHFGDNHRPFVGPLNGCTVINPGVLTPRTIDDSPKSYVGLLYEDGSVENHRLDNSANVITGVVESAADTDNKTEGFVDRFVEELEGMAEWEKIDFERLVKELIERDDVRNGVKKAMLLAMEKKQ